MVEGGTEAGTNAERVADRLRRVMLLLRRGAPEAWTGLDLTMAQMKVLFVLHHDGPAKVSDLAEVLGVSPPSMTGTLERLVRHGLVERRDHATDRRLVIISLTPAGVALLDQLHQGRRARLAAALARLDPATVDGLAQGLSALQAALELAEAEAPPEAHRLTSATSRAGAP